MLFYGFCSGWLRLRTQGIVLTTLTTHSPSSWFFFFCMGVVGKDMGTMEVLPRTLPGTLT